MSKNKILVIALLVSSILLLVGCGLVCSPTSVETSVETSSKPYAETSAQVQDNASVQTSEHNIGVENSSVEQVTSEMEESSSEPATEILKESSTEDKAAELEETSAMDEEEFIIEGVQIGSDIESNIISP